MKNQLKEIEFSNSLKDADIETLKAQVDDARALKEVGFVWY